MTTSDRARYMESFRAEQRLAGVRRVSVTLTAAEFARIKQSADAHGERITTHVKTCALAHLDARYLVPEDMAERLDTLLGVMRGIGNNLNQLARHSNEMRYFLDTEEVRLQVKRMDEVVRTFVRNPPRAQE
jgi:hypothetical protein